jgi:peroxiredoxin
VDIVTGLAAGDRAVEFELLDLDGNPTRLSDLLREKPVLLVLGSFT